MNRSELEAAIATATNTSTTAAKQFMAAFVDEAQKALKRGDFVAINGFGRFYLVQFGARNGRNPRTGATILVKAKNTVRFSPADATEQAVN